jgi:galactoside O-acetyltransferase
MKQSLRKRLRGLAVLLYQCLSPSFAGGLVYSSLVRWRFRHCGSGLRLRMTTTIRAHKNVVIGSNFVSMGHLYLYANDDGFVQIGDNCAVNTNVQIGAASGRITIGNNVMIASNVVLRAANHGLRRDTPVRFQPSSRGEIRIEDDVWIGSNAVVTANVTIARGTVVAAGAIVTRSTEPFSIVGGVPARKIGERA